MDTEKANALSSIKSSLEDQMTAFGLLDLDDGGQVLDMFQVLIDELSRRTRTFTADKPSTGNRNQNNQ